MFSLRAYRNSNPNYSSLEAKCYIQIKRYAHAGKENQGYYFLFNDLINFRLCWLNRLAQYFFPLCLRTYISLRLQFPIAIPYLIVHLKGFEPLYLPWKGKGLPLTYRCKWLCPDLNWSLVVPDHRG